jgi:tetratricopeptide (TPR) repeat protein
MDKCTNEDIGQLITFYEMGLLDDKDRTLFENHAQECEFCLHELQRMQPKLDVVFKHREELLNNLRAKGIAFENERNKLLKQSAISKAPSKTFWDGFKNFTTNKWLPKAAIPAIAAAAVIIFVLFLPKSPAPGNPYYRYLSFEKAPYLPTGGTRVRESDAQHQFNEGMRLYQVDDLQGAIDNLEKAVGIDSSQGSFWLYLGISYYLNRQPESAIDALTTARQKLDTVQRNRALWYLAQAYLLDGDAENSVPILQLLSHQRLEYAQESDRLLTKIREISPGLFKN